MSLQPIQNTAHSRWLPLRSHFIPLVVLLGINALAHFIPFERAFLSLDDLTRWLGFLLNQDLGSFIFREFLTAPDRPLQSLHYLLDGFAAGDPVLRVAVVFASSTLLVWAVYGLLAALTEHRPLALLCALCYLLLPNKVILYHTLTYAYLNFVFSLYVISFLLFVLYVKKEKLFYLLGALGSYTVAIFSYELGFFLPLLLAGVAWIYRRDKLPHALLFMIPMCFYLAWRFNLFGILPGGTQGASGEFHRLLANRFGMVPNLYFGRQMVKSVLYGFYRFPTLETPWIYLVLAADVVAIRGLWGWVKKTSFPRISRPLLFLSVASFVLFLIPASLHSQGVFERHTALASIGFVILGVAVLSSFRVHQAKVFSLLLLLGLVVCQGNAWSQVVACRINQAIFEDLKERRQEILDSKRVLIDQYSFAREIPYTWVNDPHNQLDTYWGVHALLGRGSYLMVHLAVGERKPVTVVRSSIRERGNEWVFQVYNPDLYRLEETSVPKEGSFLLNYTSVYPQGFYHGRRSQQQT